MPTVSGTFTLNSLQAQESLRKLRYEARETDRSVASLGRTLDGVGSRRQAKQLESYSRAQRVMGNEIDSSARETDKLTSSMNRHEKQVSRTSRAWRGFLSQLKEFKILAVPGKFLAIGTAVAYAVQGVVSLGGGLISLLPRITDLAKGVAPAVAGIIGLGTGAIATMLSISSLTKAMAGNKRALASLTPEAKTFLATLKAYKPVLQELRKASQQGLFPGLTAAVARGASAVGPVSQILRGSGAAVGGGALTVVRGLTQPGTLGDIGSLAKQGDTMIRSLARDFVALTRIVLNFGMAAKPFTQWVIVTTQAWMKHRAAISQFNRDSGKTAAQLERTKTALKGFVDILANLWNAFRSIGQAARSSGDSLWVSIDKASRRWRDMLGSPTEQVRLRTMFEAMRVDVEAIARLFVALEHGLLGVRAQGNTFAQMTDKLTAAIPAISKLLSNILTTFGPTLASAIKTLGDVLAGVSGWIGPWNILLTTIGGILTGIDWLAKKLPVVGGLIKDILAIALISRFLIKLDLLKAGWWKVGQAAAVAGAAEARALNAGAAGGVRGAASRLGFGFAAGRGGAATGFRDAAGMGRLTQVGAGAGALLRRGTGLLRGAGLPILAGSIAASFLPGRAGTIGQSAAAGAGLGLMFGPEGAAIGGALGAGAGLLMSQPDKQAQAAAQVGKTLNAGLGAISAYPGALGRMQAELNLYQSAAKQLADNHSAAAQAEIVQIQQAIQARRGEIAALKQEAAMRARAASIATGRFRANDLDRVMKILMGRGETRAQAALGTAERGMTMLRALPAGKGREDLAKAMVAKWALQIKSIPADAATLRGLTQQVLPFLPGGGGITAPGRTYKGTMAEVGQTARTWRGVGGPGGSEALLEQAIKPTKLQTAVYMILRAMGFPVKVSMDEAMSTDQTGRMPNIAAFLRRTAGGKALSQFGGVPTGPTWAQGLAQRNTGPHGWVTSKVPSPTGGGGVRVTWSDGTVQTVSQAAAARMQYAGGGRVPGSSLYDNYEIAPGQFAGGGELVVNRHTERKVNQMLGGRASLSGLVHGETRAHSANFAHGGTLTGLQPGIQSVADLMLGQFPGLVISSGLRPGDTGSYHATGQAVDLAGAPNLMQRAGAWAMTNLGPGLLEGIHNDTLSIKNGKPVSSMFWGTSTWNAHKNHVHLASAGGAPASAAAGTVPATGANGGMLGASPLGAYGARQQAIAQIQGLGAGWGLMPGGSLAGVPGAPGGATPPAPGGVYSKAALASLAASVGFPDPNIAAAVAMAESHGNPSAKHLNTNMSIDRGLWQINSVHKAFNSAAMFNPMANARAAFSVSGGGMNWNPWTTYTSGAYAKYLSGGGRTPAWGGWHARGGSFTADGPTLVGVGESGKEHVTVTPAGKGGGFQPIVNVNVYGGDPAQVEMAVERALMKVASHLETAGVNLDGGDF